jgi:surface antigen
LGSSRSEQGYNQQSSSRDGSSKEDNSRHSDQPDLSQDNSGGQENSGSSGKAPEGEPGTGHHFPYGQCTWYVSQQRYVPWSGNAGTWLDQAKSFGYQTGEKPKKNAIAVFGGNRFGHVALVTNVKGDQMTVSEMNYQGFGQVDNREVSVSDPTLEGFIY